LLKSQINILNEKLGLPRGPLYLGFGLNEQNKIADLLKRPHFEIQPVAMEHLQFLDLSILFHLGKDLPIEEWPNVLWPKVSAVGKTRLVSKVLPTGRRQRLLLFKHRLQSLTDVRNSISLPLLAHGVYNCFF
jgi:hypothetical protein